MKKLLLLFGVFLFCGIFNLVNSQNIQPLEANPIKTRTVYVFVQDLQLQSDANVIADYLMEFKGKIQSTELDLSSQMITIEVANMHDIDIIEVIGQKNFTAFIKKELPPAGFKYVYNPDGTWKLKEL